MKTITVDVAGLKLDLQAFSGPQTNLEKSLLELGVPIFRVVEDTDDNMVLSSWGRVLKRKKTRGGRKDYYEIVKDCYNNSGYLQVSVPRKTGVTTSTVHRLVAETFLERPEGTTEIDHIDGNKLNNKVSNLRWMSHEGNCQNPLSKNHRKPCIWKDIKAVNKKTSEVFNFRDLKEAGNFLHLSTKGWKGALSRSMRRKGGYAYGFYWWGSSLERNS